MAFTKVAAAGIGSTGTVTLEYLVVAGGGGGNGTTNLGNGADGGSGNVDGGSGGSGIVIIAYPS